MTVVYLVCFLMLGAAAVLALSRVERGPSMFDRIIGVDVLTAVFIGTVTVVAAATGRNDLVPVLVLLALVGFISSVSIARFAAAESADEARILTREELDQLLAEREALISDDAPPVHDVDTNVVIAVLDVPTRGGGAGRQRRWSRRRHTPSAEEVMGGPSPEPPGDPGDALSSGRDTYRHSRDDSDPSDPAASPTTGGAP
ncbi:monovalent cation/H+ antiporter complex subunit F [Georgenia faecalis]|uniref:Monovalent cation/H+ antiporter complex subunit F n=1 Tax=Georgenia faecalis TaxID=2483799 RepID=A0ABV9D9B6_9MICO|nr:monovalent cation/H+ antiporter complex subunit F [Georgenia faecalis]